MKNDPSPVLLTVTQYASCCQVSRTTVFAWIKTGELKEGFDYLRRRRILRFIWPPFPTGPKVNEAQDGDTQAQPLKRTPAEKKPRSKRGSLPVLNLDY